MAGKKVKRGFLGYLFLLLGILLAAFVVCIVIMIFSPGTEILGLSYYSVSAENQAINEVTVYDDNGEIVLENEKPKKLKINETSGGDVKVLDINKIVVKTNVFNVDLFKKPKNDGSIDSSLNIVVDAGFSGFMKGSKDFKIETRYNENSKVLELRLEAPVGFLNFGGNSNIEIRLPSNYDSGLDFGGLISGQKEKLNFEAETDTANISIGVKQDNKNDYTLTWLESINLKTNSGSITTNRDVVIESGTKDSFIETKSGTVTIDKPIKSKNFTVDTGSGNVVFSSDEFIVTDTFTLNSKNAFVTINQLTASKININANSGKIYAGNLTGAINFGEAVNDCHLDVNNITGSILIGTLNQEDVKTHTSVFVKQKLTGVATIATTGNVHIKEMVGDANIKTTSGEINIEKSAAKLNISTVNGNVILGKIVDEDNNFVEKGMTALVVVEATEWANIEAYFNTVVAGTTFTTKGKITAKFNPSTNFNLNAEAKKVYLNDAEQTLTENRINIHQNGGTQSINFKTESEIYLFTK